MSTLEILGNLLPATPDEALQKVLIVEDRIRQREQIKIRTEHIFHAGLYVRTVRLQPNTVFTSVLIKVPTLIVINGICDLLAGDQWVRVEGYSVIPANSGRKCIYITRGLVEITMVFPSDAKTVEEAESQFTDESHCLLSRTQDDDMVLFTGV